MTPYGEVGEILWHSHESSQATILYNEFENYNLKLLLPPPPPQRADRRN